MFPLSCLCRPTKSLSHLLVFSKNQFLVSLIFSIVLLFAISLIYTLIWTSQSQSLQHRAGGNKKCRWLAPPRRYRSPWLGVQGSGNPVSATPAQSKASVVVSWGQRQARVRSHLKHYKLFTGFYQIYKSTALSKFY